MIFIKLPMFSKVTATLFDDEVLRDLQVLLLVNAEAGEIIPGGMGLCKLRVGVPGRGKHGHGGVRVIYFRQKHQKRCYLVYAFARTIHRPDLPQIKELARVMRQEIRNG